jgi:hypothetical protein
MRMLKDKPELADNKILLALVPPGDDADGNKNKAQGMLSLYVFTRALQEAVERREAMGAEERALQHQTQPLPSRQRMEHFRDEVLASEDPFDMAVMAPLLQDFYDGVHETIGKLYFNDRVDEEWAANMLSLAIMPLPQAAHAFPPAGALVPLLQAPPVFHPDLALVPPPAPPAVPPVPALVPLPQAMAAVPPNPALVPPPQAPQAPTAAQLFTAIDNDNPVDFEIMLEAKPELSSTVGPDGNTPLHMAALQMQNPEFIRYLLEKVRSEHSSTWLLALPTPRWMITRVSPDEGGGRPGERARLHPHGPGCTHWEPPGCGAAAGRGRKGRRRSLWLLPGTRMRSVLLLRFGPTRMPYDRGGRTSDCI